MTILQVREEARSPLAGFQAHPLSWLNWNLEMLVFEAGGKPENPEKNPQSKARTNKKRNPHMAPGQNCTRAKLVGGPSALTTVPALLPILCS